MSKRSRGNDLHQTSIRRVIGLSDSLIHSVLGRDYGKAIDRRPPRAAEAFSGPRPRGGGPDAKDPDAVILEIRRLREDLGMTASGIQEHLLGLGYHLSRDRIQHIFGYATRAHLVPQSGHPSYLTESNYART